VLQIANHDDCERLKSCLFRRHVYLQMNVDDVPIFSSLRDEFPTDSRMFYAAFADFRERLLRKVTKRAMMTGKDFPCKIQGSGAVR